MLAPSLFKISHSQKKNIFNLSLYHVASSHTYVDGRGDGTKGQMMKNLAALVCITAEEASMAVKIVRLGFRRDGDKEVSQPKTEAMRVAKQTGVVAATEEEYAAALDLKCEYCGTTWRGDGQRLGYNRTRSMHAPRPTICDGIRSVHTVSVEKSGLVTSITRGIT